MEKKSLKELSETKAKQWLNKCILQLCNDYFQEISKENLEYVVSRCYIEACKENSAITINQYSQAFRELLVNYPYYKIINVSTIQTALYKILTRER